MDFDDMKVIWDTQQAHPLYAIDEAALHRRIRRKARRFSRFLGFFETFMTAVALGLVAYYLWAPLVHQTDFDRLVSAVLMGGAALYFVRESRRRRRQATAFEATLLGDLERALWEVEHHIARSRRLRWTLLVPFTLAPLIDFVFPLGNPVPVWFAVAFVALMALSAWGIEYEIRCWYEPRRRHLAALRDLLVTPA